MRHKQLRRVVSAAALTAGLIAAATIPVAHADGDDDTDFLSHTDNFGLFTDTSAADPDDNGFVANVIEGPMVNGQPLFTDILTSGADPSDSLGFGATGVGVAGETVNTFIVPSDAALDSTFSLPFTDPLADLFTLLVQLGL